MIRAYLFALDPTDAQAEVFRSHCGAQRYAYNFGLALVAANLDQRAADRSYGLTDDQLTPALSWSAFSLRRAWNAAKRDLAPWWPENSKEAYSSGLANLATALSNWSASKAGKRAGRTVAFPRFKSRRSRLSCRFTTGAVGLGTDRRHVRLPRIGLVRTHESTRKLARRIEAGTARIRSAILSHQRGRWHLAFSVELPDHEPPVRASGRVVGVDLGIKSLAVLSTREVVPNPRHLDGVLHALRRTQRRCSRRRGPDRRTRQIPSNRWRKATARVTALHTKVANARRDGLHKLTTRLVRDHDVVVIEDLNVAGMVANHHLARAISGLGLAKFRRQLDYKTRDAGVRLIVADRWYPSSKTCSACGAVRAKLTLTERQFVCDSCGTRIDRDLNAAHNLAALAAQASEPSCGKTKNERWKPTSDRHARQRVPPREDSDHEPTPPPRGSGSMNHCDTFHGTVPSRPVPAAARTTVVVVTWRGCGLVGLCLDALAAQTRPHQVLVIDNASTDGTTAEIAPRRSRVLRLTRNMGYAGALAAALPQFSTPYMAWLNDDAQPEPGWLAALEHALDNDGAAAAAASVLHAPDGAVTSTGVALTRLGYGRDSTAALPFGFCGGAALLRTDTLRTIGGVAGSLFCYYEDTDTSWRLRLAGHRILTVPDARVRHLGGASARHGTPAFHHWNERNRLLVLLRCAPARVAARELARFTALTLLLPWRRGHPRTPNFALPLRLRVLADVTARLPATLRARHHISRHCTIPRATIWSTWAGQP